MKQEKMKERRIYSRLLLNIAMFTFENQSSANNLYSNQADMFLKLDLAVSIYKC